MDLLYRLWPYIRRYLKITVAAIFCTLVVSGTSALVAWLIKPVLDGIFVKKDETLLAVLPLAVVTVYIVKGFFSFLQSYLTQYASYHVINDIRNDLYSHIMYLPLQEYQSTNTGKLTSYIINDVGALSRLASSLVKDFLQQSFTVVGLLVVIFVRDWKLAIVSVLVFPFAGLFISKYGKKMKLVGRRTQESAAGLMNIMHESFTGSKIVKAFTTEELENAKFQAEDEKYTKLTVKAGKISSIVAPTMEAVGGVAMALIIYYGGSKVIHGSMTTGAFFSFTAALFMLYGPIKALAGLHNNVQQAVAAAERVFKVFDMDTEKAAMKRGIDGPDGIKESITFEGVCFGYGSGGVNVLTDVDLTIKKGEVVALVGGSGGGKTTIANLLPRFYELQKGKILIDGVDIRDFKLKTLRQQIAVVTQDTVLFNDPVKANIAYGKDKYTDDEIMAAATAAHADIFIEKLPRKYDTVVGEKGTRLSGGEKQRISIARAILKDSPILILDEATSSLDTESERIVQKALENLMKNRTTLVIAHRLSTVINADKIVVVDSGRIEAVGSHTELLAKSPIYKKLYEMQFGGMESEHVEAV
ncbi:MAG: ABC transporter ATP-binding protein [Nitrospirota bacterium]